jgi:hypothetical protein
MAIRAKMKHFAVIVQKRMQLLMKLKNDASMKRSIVKFCVGTFTIMHIAHNQEFGLDPKLPG